MADALSTVTVVLVVAIFRTIQTKDFV